MGVSGFGNVASKQQVIDPVVVEISSESMQSMSYETMDTEKISSMKRVLMIAYHFPPIQGSSGVHRTVQFARHLPSFGWAPIVVAPHHRAYPAIGDDSWAKLPEEAIVRRAFALDSARHLSVKGKYLGVTAIPDRWISWWPAAVFECMRLVRKYKPQVIWSTYPIATAHLIGLTVSRMTGIPWVADFRDPMVQEGQPATRLNRRVHQFLEKAIVRQASRCVFVSRSVQEEFARRYSYKDPQCWQLIENGYDESMFEPYDHLYHAESKWSPGRPIKMLHSGTLYSSGRNPQCFLEAIKSVLEKNKINLEVVFRGCGNEEKVGEQISLLGLSQIVKILPPISYDEAIREMFQSDVLLVFQGSVFNKQIPAKIYEYLRTGRHILGMTDKNSETAKVLKNCGKTHISCIESREDIEKKIIEIVDSFELKKTEKRDLIKIKTFSRYQSAKKLVELLDFKRVD